MSPYYRMDGSPYNDVLEWAKDFEKPIKERRIGYTVFADGTTISTVWLGTDHRFGGGGPPLIFETMVFPAKDSLDEQDVARYSTREEALAGHKAMVRKWAKPEGQP